MSTAAIEAAGELVATGANVGGRLGAGVGWADGRGVELGAGVAGTVTVKDRARLSAARQEELLPATVCAVTR